MKEFYFRQKDNYFTIMEISISDTGWDNVRVTKVFSDGRLPQVHTVSSEQDKHEVSAALTSEFSSEWKKIGKDSIAPSELISLLEARGVPICAEISESVEDQMVEN